ncbi:glutaredoxin domain-containing cysteine-rich protein CG31559-like [Artemia franciscana]|uniref:glutaredoxin domain-containing cysteine-rich protein CG31559-like n=1 Tax=Artemia franciscana TaxID=6661 RepID=UPI0032DB603B
MSKDKPIYYFGIQTQITKRCISRRNSGGSTSISTDSEGESDGSLEQWRPPSAHIDLMRKLQVQLLSQPPISWNPNAEDVKSQVSCDSYISEESENSFAGIKDLLEQDICSVIRSGKGTVRGVRNRVRAGIATFLQDPLTKGTLERENGRLVLYITSMGIIRETFTQCLKVRRILKTLLVKFEERDVYLSIEHQEEVKRRLGGDKVAVPQLFLDGRHLGNAETVDRLNETGELRRILKMHRRSSPCRVCQKCGDYRFVPCSACHGSKKSGLRPQFNDLMVSLRCMVCDESGLVHCDKCEGEPR